MNVGLEDAFAKIVEHHDAGRTAESTECLFVQFGSDAATRCEGEQANRLAAVSEGQDKQACTAVLARVRIAHHRTVTVDRPALPLPAVSR